MSLGKAVSVKYGQKFEDYTMSLGNEQVGQKWQLYNTVDRKLDGTTDRHLYSDTSQLRR